MSIELEPSTQLAFRRPLTHLIKETLLIRNPTQLAIAFKVKTTAPKQYCVRPNSGRIEAGQELEVQVQLQPMREDPPADYRCKDKFLVQSVAITAEREHIHPAELWATVEREAKDQIREKKIRCTYLPAAGHEMDQIQEEHEPAVTPGEERAEFGLKKETQAAVTPSATAPVSVRNSSASLLDVERLKAELEQANKTIHTLQASVVKLQSETSQLRQRKPETVQASTAPTMTAVHVKQPQGYPLSYVAGAAAVSFLFAYIFF